MKPKHYCPSCHQEFSRKWNMERHVKDQHSTQDKFFFDYSPMTNARKLSRKLNMERRVKDQHSTQDKFFFDYSPMTNARKRSPILDEALAMYGISDYVRMTDDVIQICNQYSQQHAQVHSEATRGYIRSPFPNYLYFNPYPPVSEQNINDPRVIVGFKAMICERCLITITIPTLKREDSDKIKLEHSCDPNRIIEVQHYDKKQYLNYLYEQLPHKFLDSYKAQVRGTIYLTAVRMPSEISADGTIDLANIRKDHWAVKAKIECKIIPNDDELLDFLRMVGSKSPAVVNIYNSSSAESSSHYLFAIYNKPLWFES